MHTAGGGFLANFGNHPYNAVFQSLGLPDMSRYGGLAFNQALARAAVGGFAPSGVCPIVGSWMLPVAAAGGAIMNNVTNGVATYNVGTGVYTAGCGGGPAQFYGLPILLN